MKQSKKFLLVIFLILLLLMSLLLNRIEIFSEDYTTSNRLEVTRVIRYSFSEDFPVKCTEPSETSSLEKATSSDTENDVTGYDTTFNGVTNPSTSSEVTKLTLAITVVLFIVLAGLLYNRRRET